MSLDLSIKPTQGEVTQIKIFQEKNKNNLTLSTGTNTVTLSLDASQKDQKNLTFSMTQDTTEIVRIIGNLKYEDTRVSEVNFTFSSPAQGLTATLLQKNAKDGSFEGNLNI